MTLLTIPIGVPDLDICVAAFRDYRFRAEVIIPFIGKANGILAFTQWVGCAIHLPSGMFLLTVLSYHQPFARAQVGTLLMPMIQHQDA